MTIGAGNERRGLAREHRAICDWTVGIPMAGRVDSLNVAVATGIVLFEVFDQHRRMEGDTTMSAGTGAGR